MSDEMAVFGEPTVLDDVNGQIGDLEFALHEVQDSLDQTKGCLLAGDTFDGGGMNSVMRMIYETMRQNLVQRALNLLDELEDLRDMADEMRADGIEETRHYLDRVA